MNSQLASNRIEKKATDSHRFARQVIPFRDARSAFKAVLHEADLSAGGVLLPAYIGWSGNEGSGVFDPVLDVGAPYRFYRVTRGLAIDVDDLYAKLVTHKPSVLLLIHYFGYPDDRVQEVVEYARKHDVLIVEDEAHALYTDWIGGTSGRLGDLGIMSLHKMLPVDSGGVLILNSSLNAELRLRLQSSNLQEPLVHLPLDYDLYGIARARCTNAAKLLKLLQPLSGRVDPLHPTLAPGVVPQTLPVLIKSASRDAIYFEMNDSGYGVVSLYHTLVAAIDRREFPDSYWLAERVLNLPIHQDVASGQLAAMVNKLATLV